MVRPRPLIIITGPTASGKSALSVTLAQDLDGEIISCDSVQVYRGFDIGSAKASASEQNLVPHHLIDVCEASEQYNAARFRSEALDSIDAIRARGHQPFIVGGTTLYISALLSGLSRLPDTDPELRARLEIMPADERLAMLKSRDPSRASELHPNDVLRIVRALEVSLQSGKTLKELRECELDEAPPIDALIISLAVDVDILRERIGKRTQLMLSAGLVDETRSLLQRHKVSDPPFSTVGYRESVSFIKGELSEAELVERITIATRQLAKRQRTFWRNEPRKRGWKVRDLRIETDIDREKQLRDLVVDRLALGLSGVEVWHVEW